MNIRNMERSEVASNQDLGQQHVARALDSDSSKKQQTRVRKINVMFVGLKTTNDLLTCCTNYNQNQCNFRRLHYHNKPTSRDY